jgi:predicted DNA-binding transcriptional regulator YafY
MTQITELADFKAEWYSNATEEERKTFREWLLGVLDQHEKVTVTFKKADGTLREMNCTTKEGIRPVVENKKTSDTLCTVWDTDLNAWRSFKFENITQINFSL